MSILTLIFLVVLSCVITFYGYIIYPMVWKFISGIFISFCNFAFRIILLMGILVISAFVGSITIFLLNVIDILIKINVVEKVFEFLKWYLTEIVQLNTLPLLDNEISAYTFIIFILFFVWVYYSIFKYIFDKIAIFQKIIENRVNINDFTVMITGFGLVPFVIDNVGDESLIGNSIKMILLCLFILSLVPSIYFLYKK